MLAFGMISESFTGGTCTTIKIQDTLKK